MPEHSLIEAVKPDKPDREFWRNCASELGGGEWFNVRRVGSTAHVLIYGDIGYGENFNRLIQEIGDATDLRLTVNSSGGDSIAALAFAQTFAGRISEATINGKAFSSGYFILMTAAKIRMARDAKILLHAPASFAYGSAEEFAGISRSLAHTTNAIADLLRQRTELPEEVVGAWLDGADFYFTAEQAKAFGLVDKIFDSQKPTVAAPAIQQSAQVAESPVPQMEFTEEELFAFDLLRALGKVRVKNKNYFLRELNAWAIYSTIETSK